MYVIRWIAWPSQPKLKYQGLFEMVAIPFLLPRVIPTAYYYYGTSQFHPIFPTQAIVYG